MLKHKNIFFISLILMLLFMTASGVSAVDDNATDELDAYEIDEDSNIELENNDGDFNELESNNEDIIAEEDGLLDPTEAYESLNEFRAEEGAWYWNGDDTTITYFNTNEHNQLQPLERDLDLEEAAKIRAQELSELFEHQRPDGTDCFSIYPSGYWMQGENIAIAYTGKDATEAWKEDFLPCREQGHRQNMLNPVFNSVGIAGYSKDGMHYWIQAFGYKYVPKNDTENGTPADTSKGSLNDLNDLIENNIAVTLEKDYAYNNDTGFKDGIIINKTMTIDGAGHSIDSKDFARIFVVLKDNVVIKNIKFINGSSNYGYGGALYCEGNNLTLINCSFIDNDGYYGSVFLTNGNVTFKDCSFSDNLNVEGTVYANNSDVSFENCRFENNNAILYGGALSLNNGAFSLSDCSFIGNGGYKGGAVSSSNAKLRIKNSAFNRNDGVLYGGALSLNNVEVSLESSDFNSNIVTAFANVFGGAIFLDKGKISVMECNFNDNKADSPLGIGGSIYANEGEIHIMNCDFANNNATGYGGAVCSNEGNITVEDSRFESNYVGYGYYTTYGGAIYACDGEATVKDCNFTDNFAKVNGGAVSFKNANGNIVNCNFENDTTEFNGGAVYCENGDCSISDCNFNNGHSNYGGAVYLGSGKGNVLNCNFNNNIADTCGGAVYLVEGNYSLKDCILDNNSIKTDYSSNGGALFSTFGNVTIEKCSFTNNYVNSQSYYSRGAALHLFNSTLTLKESTFSNNSADTDGAIFSNYGSAKIINCSFSNAVAFTAGAIYSTNANVTVKDSTFTKLKANSGGAIYLLNGNLYLNNDIFTDNFVEGGGSVAYCENCNVSIADSMFKDNAVNDAFSDSGALYLNNNNVSIADSQFINNIGGGLFSNYGDVSIEKCIFMNNHINSSSYFAYGGAVNSDNGNITVKDSIFTNNSINSLYEANGAAISAKNGKATVANCNFSNNSAYSGASIASNNADVEVNNCSFINETSNSGSALSLTNSKATVSNSNFANSIASSYGGAIYSTQSSISLSKCSFINESAYCGGAIYSYNGNATIKDCSFENNKANGQGGAVYSYYGETNLINCNLTNNSAGYGGAAYGCNALNSIFEENTATYWAGAMYGVDNTASKCKFIKNVASKNNPTFNVTAKDCTFTGNRLIIRATLNAEDSTLYTGDYYFIDLYTQDYEWIRNATVTVRVYKNNALEDSLNCTSGGAWRVLLGGGTYIVSLSVENQDYIVNPLNVTLTVIEREIAEITASVNNDTYLKPTAADITSNVEGGVDLFIDGVWSGYINVAAKKTAQVTFDSIPAGKHTFEAYLYPADSNIESTSCTTEFEVYRKETSVSLDVKDTTKSQNVIVNVKASENGNAIVKLASITKNVNVNANVNTQIDFGVLKSGSYDVTASFSAGENYIDSKASKTFTVFDEITQDSVEIKMPQNNSSDVAISIPNDAKGTITLTIAGKDYSVDVVGGAADIKLPDLADGNYDYTISYSGDDKYSAFSIDGSLSVGSSANITIKPTVEIPELDDGNSKIQLPEDATGTVTLTINGESYEFDVVNGVADVKLPKLKNGDYSYTITYSGDGKYSSFTQTNNLAVDNPIIPVITATNLKALYTAKPYYSIKVTDADGDVLSGETVVITANGKAFKTLKTNANGIAKFKVTQTPGTYKLSIKVLDKSVTKTLTVKHLLTLKTVTVKKSAKKLVLTASLAKVNKKYLKGKKITFKFNGKKYTAKTNKKGVAKVTIKSKVLKKLKVGKKVAYQATYLKDTVAKKAKVKK